MAGTLTRDGAIGVLEDAVRLLRQASLGALACHWIGSAPFALALLRFWNDVSNPRTLDSSTALEALGLALLLVWMNCWRAVFAGRLRGTGILASVRTSWTRRRIVNLVATQAFLGATKLVTLPLAILVLFPLASTVAFYRNTAVLADREDLDPLQLMARAKQLAGLDARESWALMPLLALLYVLVLANLAIALAMLPQLVRILTGYESAFSRSGYLFAFNPLFFLLVIAVSWIAFDPFIQAVYCVRCYRGESLETGEDLRAALRLIPAGGRALLLALVFLAIPSHSSAAVPPGELEKSVRLTMESHEYDWRLPPAIATPVKRSWAARLTDRIIAGFKSVAGSIYRAFRRFREWVRGNRAPQPQPGTLPDTGLHWSLYALTGAVVLAAMAVWWRRSLSRREKPKSAADGLAAVIRLDADDLSADRLPEERWIELAAQCLQEGNFRLALRALYLANLAWLGRREFLAIDAGKTNREYELELRRRARAFPDARSVFAQNVAAFERAWYGLHEVSPEDIATFRARIDQMKSILPAVEEAAA